MARKQITLSDIAEACGTSSVTVSKALSGKSGMSNELRNRIIATAERMGYVSQKSAPTSGIIGVLIPEKFMNPNGSFYWALYNSLVQRLKKENFSCVQESITWEEEKKLVMPAFLGGPNIVGVISLGQLDRSYAKKLREKARTLLLLDYYIDGVEADSIVSDGVLGGYRLTSYLIENGHTDIGFVGTKLATSSIFDRYMGYVKAMLEHGLPLRDDRLIEDRTVSNEPFEGIAFPKDMPTAFVCNCDETAFKVVRDLKARGFSVPDDISVVGYDNYLISEISDPPITTINVDSKEMAELAVSVILERVRNSRLPIRTQVLNGKLVKKGSVKKLIK